MGLRVICWNIQKMHAPWRALAAMNADIALLQEASPPPEDVTRLHIGPRDAWDSHGWNSDWWHGRWPALYDRWPMVVRLSDRVDIEWFTQVTEVDGTAPDEIQVSGVGIIAAARVTARDGSVAPFIAVSMYARWMGPHPTARGNDTYPDASAHRIISDLSTFIGYYDKPEQHRILAAGDLNMAFESTDPFNDRAQTVLDRFRALGIEYLGPQYPRGRRADPVPAHLTADSLDVPTYYHKPSNTPEGASVQLDHVFASRGFHAGVTAYALNGVDEWGPSDHCRLRIDIADD